MSSITSKLIRNAPGTDPAAAEGGGPVKDIKDTSTTCETNEAAAPGRLITLI